MQSEAFRRRVLAAVSATLTTAGSTVGITAVAAALGTACEQNPANSAGKHASEASSNAAIQSTSTASLAGPQPPGGPVALESERLASERLASAGPAPEPTRVTVSVLPPTGQSCVDLKGTKREKLCVESGTHPPQGMILNNASDLDANGCASAANLHDPCGGVQRVLSGPTVNAKQCCYTICRGQEMPCGRPLFIEDARVASAAKPYVSHSGGWTNPATRLQSACTRSGTAALRYALSAAWLNDALMEHASVASFARFSLELLAVGAPADLIRDSQRAALDEIDHAQACFDLAQAYDAEQRPHAPAPLDLAGLRVRSGLIEVAAAATREACCDETFAALALLHASEECTDMHVKAVLERIAGDEMRHAELGYRFVAWAVAIGGEPVRAAVAAAFVQSLSHLQNAKNSHATHPFPNDRAAWRGAGRLGPQELRAVQDETWTRIIVPAARQLANPRV